MITQAPKNLLIIALFALSFFFMQQSANAQAVMHIEAGDVVPNQYILIASPHGLTKNIKLLSRSFKLKGPVKKKRQFAIKSFGESFGFDVVGQVEANTIVVKSDPKSIDYALEAAAADRSIRVIEPDYLAKISFTPTDPAYTTDRWAKTQILSEQANDLSQGQNVVVAVADTGVDYNHPDLAANIYTNPGEIANNGIDDDNNGKIDDIRGWDFVNNDNNPMDDHYHGTHCAGTIGMVANNGVGSAGVAPQVKILPLKVLAYNGSGSYSGIASAIYYFADLMVKLGKSSSVISMSLGGPGPVTSLDLALQYAEARGVVSVSAAGNSSSNNDVTSNYPSNSDYNTVAVAATTSSGTRASFSSYGATKVDVAAPGSYIYSTYPNNSYNSISGTSMATPHVAGVVALYLALAPNSTPSQIRTKIISTATPNSNWTGLVASGGIVNAYSLVRSVGLSITGRATYSSVARGLAGATVSAKLGSQVVATTTTGSDGSYTLTPVSQNTNYTIEFSHPKCQTQTTSAIVQTQSVAISAFNLSCTMARLVVSFWDANNQGVAGISVNAGAYGSFTSDSNGEIQIQQILSGSTYSLSYSKAGYNFTPSSGISGTIDSDIARRVIAEIQKFSATVNTYTSGSNFVIKTNLGDYTTDLNGIVSIPNIPYGTRLEVEPTSADGKYNFIPSTRTVESVTSNQVLPFSTSVVRHSVKIIVKNSAGRAAEGARVITNLSYGGYPLILLPNQTELSFSVIHGDPVNVRVEGPGRIFSPSTQVSRVINENTELVFTWQKSQYTVAGVVKDSSGKAVSGVRVSRLGTGWAVNTGADGKFSTLVNNGESFTLNLSASGKAIDQPVINGIADEDKSFNITALSSVALTVSAKTSEGLPISNAYVSVTGQARKATNSEGNAVFAVKPNMSSALRVSVAKEGYTFSSTSVSVANSDQSLEVIGTPITYDISGKVLLPNRSGLAGVTVTAGDYGSAITASDGSYTISDLPHKASFNLSISAPSGYAVVGNSSVAMIVTRDQLKNWNAKLIPILVKGTVQCKGAALARANVGVYYGSKLVRLVTNSSGAFSKALEIAPGASVSVSASDPKRNGCATYQTQSITASGSEIVFSFSK